MLVRDGDMLRLKVEAVALHRDATTGVIDSQSYTHWSAICNATALHRDKRTAEPSDKAVG
jgi:hypothetical protein